jgi:uncharacterized protein (DUF2147 family)
MALTALKGKKIKKRAPRARSKTGLAAAPIDKGFAIFQNYVHFEVDRKDLSSSLKNYVKKAFNKKDAASILANPEYKFYSMTHYCAIAYWLSTELPVDEKVEYWTNSLNNYLEKLKADGKVIQAEKKSEGKVDNVVTLSPAQRLQNKISNTIMQDLLNLEDAWMDGEKITLDLYSQFKLHGLSGSATIPVRNVVEGWLLDYEDAYLKRCDQAVEGYSHLKKPELKRRVEECKTMLADLDRIKSAARATRAIKSTNKPRAADKQVAKVKYKKQDNDFKLVSIPPIKIIGSFRLYTFNTKTRVLSEYLTEHPRGFEISGTTIKNIGPKSRSVRLRKPNDFLPFALGKTPNQIDKEWQKLTTKSTVPNGRLNSDTILLRVIDK